MSATGRTTLLLFFTFQALYGLTSSGNTFRIPDEFEVYFQVEHFVDAGDISVPQTLTIRRPVVEHGQVVGSQTVFFGEIGRDGKPYAPYGPLAALLALPHHLIARLIARIAGVPRGTPPASVAWVFLVGGLTMISSATAAALAVAGFHRTTLALGASHQLALTLSLLLGGATVLWPYGTSFYSEAWQASAFIWAAALLLEARARPSRGPALVVTASLLLTVAGLTKVTSLVFAPGFVVAALADRSSTRDARLRTAVALSLGIGLAAALHLAWNAHRFVSPFDFGYDWGETIPQPPARAFLLSDLPRGLAVLLLSPGKSIVLWAPVLLLVATRVPQFWRREPGLALGLSITAATGLVFYGAYLFPEGGYSHGPRHLVPILPLLMLPATGPERRPWPRAAILTVAVAGAAIAMLAVSISFLEDQGIRGDLGSDRFAYYARIAPAPGRAWNQYRLEYIPFAASLSSGEWLRSNTLGQGPDVFPYHLMRARRMLPGGAQIPVWLVWILPSGWLLLLAAASRGLWKHERRAPLHAIA